MKYLLLGIAFALAALAYAYDADASARATVCTMEYAPVCGMQTSCNKPSMTYGKGERDVPCTTYKTYGNRCMLNAEGAAFVHEGECGAGESGEGSQPKEPVTPPEAEPAKAYEPPQGCASWFDGCNSCTNEACTKKSCTAYEPGYCTKWAEEPAAPIPAGDESAGAQTNASAATGVLGLFIGLWASFLAWF